MSKDLKKLLLKDSGDAGESFDLVYRGHSEIDRHYTKPMLPWIISEIKNQHRMQQVTVNVKDGNFEVREKDTNIEVLSHSVKQIHKCVMEQADHRCFLYTLRPASTLISLSSINHCNEPILLPSNVSHDQNYHCHLYQALTEQEVRNFFSALRQQPKESKSKETSSSPFNSMAELSVHTGSQFFEVLFVGRVKVSHFKVPVTFIDEALQAFRHKERERQRNTSGESHQRSSPSRLMSFQQEGSGYSVPNIVLRAPADLDTLHKNGSKSAQDSIQERERGDQITITDLKAILKNMDVSSESDGGPVDPHPTSSPPTQASSLLSVEPLKQRVRTVSCGIPDDLCQEGGAAPRGRTGSMGSTMIARYRTLRPSESDLKALGYDFNRTMLFHIGHREIQLVNPELKSVQLNKPFKDIAGCCQGVKASDHFGFICRELSGDAIVYVGYIFRCDKTSVADEIMQVLNRSFSAMHEAHQKERQEHLMCDHCPLKWLSQLCGEVEGLAAARAHQIIMKRVTGLPDEERDSIIAKFEGAETSDLAHKNNVLMMLLRTHFEYKQMNHSHPSQTAPNKQDSNLGTNIESSLKRAKKSLTSSFSSFLKRDQESFERESPPMEPKPPPPTIALAPTIAETESAAPAEMLPDAACVLGITDSPLRGHRPRSSTVSGAGGDSMRKEFLAKKALANQRKRADEGASWSKGTEKENVPPPGASMGAPAPQQKIHKSEIRISEMEGTPSKPMESAALSASDARTPTRPATSFRHAILQRVVTPAKGISESPGRKMSVEKMGSTDKPGVPRSRSELKIIWKKAVFQQILLLKIEKENQRLRALQNEAALQRVRLNYEEEEPPCEATQAWELLLSRPHARIDSNVLHSGIRQGVPKLVRGQVWQLLTVQHQRFKSADEGLPSSYDAPYEEMLKELTSQQHAILIDLGRTFPGHPYYTQTLGPGQLALFNILKAYSILDKEVGYCQGLSFVVGVLLLHVEEELSYDLFKHLMFQMDCRKQYTPDLDGLQILMYQLSRLVHDKMKDLYVHLEKHSITPQLYAAPWFLTLFASQFSLNFVVRVFDYLFLMGMEAVVYVAFVLLRSNSELLLQQRSFEQIMEHFKSSFPLIGTSHLNAFFNEVSDCAFSKELSAYEVEYRVLQEELSVSPQYDADVRKLRESNRNLKRQNLDLIEQLNKTNHQHQALNTLTQSLQQNQHHLEVRVRWLELEKNNMRQVIEILSRNVPEEILEGEVPPNLERYLPHKAASPMPEDRRLTPSPSNKLGGFLHDSIFDPFVNSGVKAPRQSSLSPSRSPQGRYEPPIEEDAPRARSTTLDTKSLHKYFKLG